MSFIITFYFYRLRNSFKNGAYTYCGRNKTLCTFRAYTSIVVLPKKYCGEAKPQY